MAQYDIEAVLSDVQAFLAANLNTQISSINTEKNDGVLLKSVDSSAYHLQYLEDRVDAMDPIVLYGEAAEPTVQGIGPGTAITYRVSVWLILSDPGMDIKIAVRLFRYRRALIDLFQANWATFAREHKMKVAASMPSPPFKDQEKGWIGRAVGIVISLTVVE